MLKQNTKTIVASQAELRQLLQEENEKVIDRLLSAHRPQSPKTFTAKQAAEYLGISLSTLYKNVSRIPHRRFGKKLLFRSTDLDGFNFHGNEAPPLEYAASQENRQGTTTSSRRGTRGWPHDVL